MVSNHDEVTISNLQNQVQQLRRHIRVLMLFVVCMLAWFGLKSVLSRDVIAQEDKKAEPNPETLQVKQLTVLDKSGNPRIRFGTRTDTAPYICLYSPKGEKRVTLLASEDVSEVVIEYNSRCIALTTEKALAGFAMGQRTKESMKHGLRIDDTDGGTVLGMKDYNDPDEKHRIQIGKLGKSYDIKITK